MPEKLFLEELIEKTPHKRRLIINFYSFGKIAFKINAESPAGINPVVRSNGNLIPRSGKWLTNSGFKYKPIPKDKERPSINKLRLFKSDWDINLIPAAVIKPNITIAAPPRIDSGIAAITPPNLGNKPNKTKIIPAMVPTCLLITPVKATNPAFCE